MNKTERNKLYKDILIEKGLTNQLYQLIEECAEVIHATNKFKRKGTEKYLIEELADLEIMIKQIKNALCINAKVELQKDNKLKLIKTKLLENEL